jgi:hypothetical protein
MNNSDPTQLLQPKTKSLSHVLLFPFLFCSFALLLCLFALLLLLPASACLLLLFFFALCHLSTPLLPN